MSPMRAAALDGSRAFTWPCEVPMVTIWVVPRYSTPKTWPHPSGVRFLSAIRRSAAPRAPGCDRPSWQFITSAAAVPTLRRLGSRSSGGKEPRSRSPPRPAAPAQSCGARLPRGGSGRRAPCGRDACNGGLEAGWTTIDVPQASEDGGRPETPRLGF
jgi:hypothetical protein